jgi:diphthamide synthase (EF-2-diphthine--ammonia ligase)
MTPRIGVYQHDSVLYETLLDAYFYVSNRDLLCALISQPFHNIRVAVAEGTAGEYVLRERHRRWVENVEEHIGVWVPLPSWELLAETSEWIEESGMSDAFFCDMPEWMIFGDDCEIAFDVLDKLPYTVWMDDNLEQVVQSMLQIKPDIRDLIVLTRDLFTVYVIRSEKIEGHGINVEELAHTGFHAFYDLGNAIEAGEYPTYVLDDKTVEIYAEKLEEHRKWEAEYDLRRRNAS